MTAKLDAKKRAFLAEVLGDELAEKVIEEAEGQSHDLEDTVMYKAAKQAVSFADYDADLDVRLNKTLYDVYRDITKSILDNAHGEDPAVIAEKMRQATEDFKARLEAPLSRRPGKPGKGDQERYGVGYGYPPPEEANKLPYHELRKRQLKAEKRKTLADLHASPHPVAGYILDLIEGGREDAGIGLQAKVLQEEQTGAAPYVGDLLAGKIVGAPIRQDED